MNSVHEIIEKIHNEWEIEPKKAIQRGMECPFPLQCSLNLKSKIYPQIPQVLLPKVLEDFYTVSNGADLFKDQEYGQWGLKLYSIEEVTFASKIYKSNRKNDALQSDLIIGEFYGDSDLLLVRCDPNSDDYGSILVVLPVDQRQDWYIIANTFEEFINKFYESQGDKFWEH